MDEIKVLFILMFVSLVLASTSHAQDPHHSAKVFAPVELNCVVLVSDNGHTKTTICTNNSTEVATKNPKE